VLPGITGWAQVNGRNAISWPQKFALDTWYAEHVSFGLDLRIMLLTFRAVLVRSGINAEGAATMPEFLGNESSMSVSRGTRQ
jgi:lipopolysaccharide/colanic/teichoic acid biosynthesis glycosyltransferase